jgi:hypothetical protein
LQDFSFFNLSFPVENKRGNKEKEERLKGERKERRNNRKRDKVN